MSSEPVRVPSTLVELLRERGRTGAAGGYGFLDDAGAVAAELSFPELDRRARSIAAVLGRAGSPGDRVLLLYPSGLDYVEAFYGCLYAGRVAVPVYPPGSDRTLPRLRAVVEDARPATVLTTSQLRERVEDAGRHVAALGALPVLATDAVDGAEADGWREPRVTGETEAFLQYTSGSTRSPRGVVLRHRHLLDNERAIRRAFGQSAESVVVSWLPLYHDMGLIGGVLQPLYVGGRCLLMSPVSFLQKPARWLEAIARYRATTSGGPNFAYDLCVRKIPKAARPELDLSAWRVAFNGAEPVRAETLRRFAEAFAVSGFRAGAFFPCYGLAEATLFVTGRGPDEPVRVEAFAVADLERGRAVPADTGAPGGEAPAVRSLVSSGRPADGTRVVVADPETGGPKREGEVGEIWISGPAVAAGYHGRPEDTQEVFGARLAGAPDGEGEAVFLRTGDLGFRWRGELFVTGRLKDLIILRGRNLAPQDIELSAERSHPAFRPGGSAAFSIDAGGEERLVIIQEVEPREVRRIDGEEAATAVRSAVADEHSAQVHDVVLLRAGSIPRTSSGKVQRRASRRAYLDGSLPVLHRVPGPAEAPAAPPAELAADLAGPDGLAKLVRDRILALGGSVPAAGVSRSLPEMGLDSLAIARLGHALEEAVGESPPLAELFDATGVEDVAGRLAARLAAAAGGGAAPEPATAEAERPLTPDQEALWLLDRRSPESGVSHVGGAVRSAEPLDAARLERAVEALARRHPALRTLFRASGERARQRVVADLHPGVEVVEVGSLAEDDLKRRVEAWIARPFELEKGPPLRVALWRGTAGDVLSLAAHHLVADLWSLTVVARDLGLLYRRDGESEELPRLAATPFDVFEARARRLEGPEGERLRRYWSERLADPPAAPELPTDRPRPRVPDHRGGRVVISLSEADTLALDRLARERDATRFMVLLAGVDAWLHRITGEEDLVVGSPFSGRTDSRSASLVGYFVRMLPLRVDLSDEPRFGDLVERVRSATLGALRHQDPPRALLDGEGGDGDGAAPFRVVLALQRAHLPGTDGLAACVLGRDGVPLEVGGLAMESVGLGPAPAQFDLALIAAESEGRLALSVEYAAALFDPGTAERFAAGLERVLRAGIAEPSTRLGDLPLLADAELLRLRDWSRRPFHPDAAPGAESIPSQVVARARRRPEALAVRDGGTALSYGALVAAAHRMAGRLARAGAGPERLVATCLPLSADLLVAQLGALLTGAAYLPLDPAQPNSRLSDVLADAEVCALVMPASRPGPRPPLGCTVIDPAAVRAESDSPPDPLPVPRSVPPDALAYVIYTSGSTGRPKGVAIPHAGLDNLARWHGSAFRVTADDRMTLLASPGFDASVWEIWPALVSGASLHVVDDDLRASSARLVRWLAENGITLCFLPTPLAEEVLAEPWPAGAGPRVVLTGGDRLVTRPRPDAPFRLVNHYGPTEATVVATAAEVGARGEGPPPIGRPIPGLSTWVTDRRLRPRPPGLSGELTIGGAGLARGYRGRPAATAEAFVPDPFAEEPGARRYRTGDRVRHGADGALEFLGRLDRQVQVRGVRVEPGEIEVALAAHPGVAQAVVAVRRVAAADRLVAYLTGAGERPAAGELRSWLARRLPAAMVPSAFVFLDAFPRTTRGKIDRASLPEIALPDLSAGAGEAPRTPVERRLADLWSEVLGETVIGRETDFFALGGDSLRAARMLGRVRRELDVELPLTAIFEEPTLAALAGRIEEAPAGGAARAPLPAADGEGLRRDFPLTYAQERLWLHDRLDPGAPAYNIPGAWRIAGDLDVAALAASLGALVRRHAVLRTSFHAADDAGPVQRIDDEAGLPLPRVDLSALPAARRQASAAALAEAEGARRFDLERPPLVRARLVVLDEREHVLLVTLHHIVADGTSAALFEHELEDLYAAFSEGRPPRGPDPPVRYADYAAWQRRWLRGDVLAARVASATDRLAGAPTALDLPTDRPRRPRHTRRGDQVPLSLPAETAEAVRRLGRRFGATPYMTLLAAFAAWLHRVTGEDDLVVGSPVDVRDRPETETVVGCFVNLLPVRIDLSGDPAFADLLDRVRRAATAAYRHRDVPFEKLVEASRAERVVGESPLVQVVFSLDPKPQDLRLPGLEVAPLPARRGAAKFDLSFVLADGADRFDGYLEYDADLFDRATADEIAERISRVAAEAAAEPERRVSDLAGLGAGERETVLREWAVGERLAPPRRSVYQRIAEQARRAPGALALARGETRWTYGELVRGAGRLAAALRRRGVGPELRVGVLAAGGPARVLGQLAVLAAGGAYVPLDPAYPDARLGDLLDDSKPTALLVEPELADRLADRDVPVVPLVPPALGAADGEAPGEAPAEEPPPDALAYVVFTSGSTGRPKGVAVPRRGLDNLVAWHLDAYRLTPDDRVSQMAAPGFDAAVWEVWPSLCAGASLLWPADDEVRASGERVAAWLAAEAVTVSFLPTPLAEEMLARASGDALARLPLRVLLTGGDRLRRRPPPDLPWPLVNHYGPTESTVVTTASTVSQDGAGAPAIGRPIANLRTYVVDRAGAPALPGAAGELRIGGPGVARGYLGRPGETAEAFVPDPFGERPGGRLYRTGDRTRLDRGGVLSFVGRIDHQVKVRGFRIEPGEVEAALTGSPGVAEAAVVAREGAAGGARLIGYFVLDAPGSRTEDDLLRCLRQRLPPFMVPSRLVELSALPLTRHGKVDRRALPEPEGPEDALTPPRTPTEELLVSVWSEVLELDGVGVHQDFFALGGHSLLGTRLVARVRDALGADLELRTLFENPTVAELGRRIDEAGAADRPRLDDGPPLVPREDPGDAPLSYSQERLWFLSQLDEAGSAFNISGRIELAGDLRAGAMEETLRRVIARQGSLRTTFVAERGRPAQRVHPAGEWRLPRIDLRGLDPALRAAEVERVRRLQAGAPFDLEQGPLMLVRLVRLEDRLHHLDITLHHIVADGWSMDVLVRETMALYRSIVRGEAEPAPALPPTPAIQYADYAAWQRRWLGGERLERLLDYWRERFAEVPPPLELPTDRPRPQAPTFHGDRVVARMTGDLEAAIAGACRQGAVTRHMVVLTAFTALLHRYTGEADLCVGTFVANRNRPEVEGLIGFFVNNLALRVAIAPDGSWRNLLAEVRDVTLGAYDHQDLPFERLLNELEIQRGADWTPLFRVLCVHQNMPRTTFELPGLEARPRPGDFDSARFDLTLWLEEDDGLEAALDYATDLFDRATAERLLGHFETVLAAGLRAPSTPVAALDLLTPKEREQLTAWNRTGSSWPLPASPIREIAERARRRPDRVAVTDGARSLTYGGLHREASRLAGILVAHGVGPEVVVGICIERSIEMIVALLAVLEAGGGYLPLDPTYPRERLAFMLDDSPVALVITRSGLAAALPRHEAPIVEIDREGAAIAVSPAGPPPDRGGPLGLAYLVYTSGSTGRPKAVVVSRRGLANHTRSAAEAYELSEDDRALQFASINFDASAEEIYPTLARGGTLILRSEEMLRTPATFLDRCAALGVTILNLPTAYWHTLATAIGGGAELPPAVRVVIIGGERALAARVEEWRRRVAGDSRLVNTYGPTEATVVATRADVGGGSGEAVPPGEVSMGRPISNLRALVLDARGRELPVGVPGELVLGGAGIARGYLGRPGLTAERFVPGAADGGEPDRLYRTGDLVVRRGDGGLEFVGRTDDQVKIRGFRVELGEVASRLARHPALRDAAAVAWEPEPGRRQLVAYASTAPDAAEPTVSELRAFLGERLPDYMVPSTFVLMDELPRNASGKLDRARLPEPERTRPELQGDFVPPGSPTEEVLASIWGELLGVGAVGIHDDFFELGGYSLLATQVIARASEALGVELSLASLFEAPTVAQQARQIEESRREALPPIEPVPRDGDLPLSFAQERIWFLTQLRPGDTSYHVPRGLRITGSLRLDALVHAYSEVTVRHEILRTIYPAVDGRPVQRILPPRRFDIPLIDLSGLATERADEEVRSRTLEMGNRRFDFDRGPMIRAAVFRLAGDVHFFYQVEHHLVHDGWAEGVLLRDLLENYTAFVEERPARLPAMTIQFADLSAWQRRWMVGEVMERQLEYWRRELAGAPALLALPTDRPRPEVRSGLGVETVLMLSTDRADRIRKLTRQVDATLFMAMKSAFDTILYRYSGQRDFVVGTTIANRRHRTAEGLLGMVVNTVPLRTRLEPESGFRDLVAVVRESCLGAYAHQDMPFEKLVEELRPHRRLEQTPLFQVAFGFHDAPHPEMSLPGAEVEYVQVHNRSAKFDMAAIVVPAGDEMVLLFEHSEDLFDTTTIHRVRSHFLRVLDQAAEDPERRLVDLALLEPSETQQMLVEWNDGRNRAYVVDPYLGLQPMGVPGEVMAGGRGVERSGDLPAWEVARRWVPDVLTGEPGARLYRTGASARRATDGTLRRAVPAAGGARPAADETVTVESLLPALGYGPGGSLGAWDGWDPVEEAERRHLLHDLQGRVAAYPVDPTHHRIARRIEASPDAIAVTTGDAGLSYRELGRRAGRLARRLRGLGAGADRTVALFLDRGLDMAVALLAVLESGAAYVPIDPELPAPRIAGMLASCRPAALVTSADLAALLPATDGPSPPRVLAGEAAAGSPPDAGAPAPLPGDVHPDQLAYVLYTSGSSGEPKGVMVSHRALSNHMSWMDEDHPLGAGDRVLQRTSYGFDASVWEIFYPWIAGARLVLARPGGQRDVPYLLETVEREGVTVLPGVPTLLRQLAADPALERCASVRLVYSGAEPLAPELVRALDERLGCPVVNFYGPTETTIEVTSHVCSPDGGSVPIGRPIANSTAHVLDPRMRLLPRGALGELYIGGPPVARGYLGRPGETARLFVPDPLSPEPGARLYATGDLARWRADTTLESFGRRDFQVKVRGQRVELEAVEAALRSRPAVHDAMAAVRRGADGVDTLVGYVVPADGARLSAVELRRELRSALPGAMIPDRFVALPSLPVLPSGKVDRRALPDPEAAAPGSDRFEPPATVVEEMLASVWRDLLGRERIGANDDFFALGGHSLLATRVTARVREAFGIDLPVRELFDAPTLRGLATAIARLRGEEAASAPSLRPSPAGGAAPLSFAQERLWFLNRLEPESPAYNVASSVLLEGPLTAAALFRAFGEVTRRHAVLRTRFPEVGGGPVQETGGPAPALAVVDLAGLSPGRRDGVARNLAGSLARRPFDLLRGPVARIALARLGPETHLLVLVLHHIVSDGWSMGVLVRELTALYDAFRRGEPSPLPALPVQYVDYARWQRRWLGEERIAAELAYWRRQLDGAVPLLDLAPDRPRPAVPTYRSDDLAVEIGPGATEALRRLAREETATLHMIVLAGFQLLLARRGGVSDVVVGVPIAGRDRTEVEDLVGLFVNTLALRTDLSGAPGFRELLARVRRISLDAHQHRELPFERLVQELRPERELGHSPVFQVMLAFQDAEPSETREAERRAESDLRTVPVPTRTGVAQFDLELVLRPRAERIVGALRYKLDLFDGTTARRMADAFGRLMAGVAEDPETAIWDVGLLSAAERWQVVGEWNDTALPIPRRDGFLRVFDRTVEASPDAIALACDDAMLSYRGLDRWTAAVAARLAVAGAGPESTVAILCERGLGYWIAALGALRARAAFLPLDPRHPAPRIRQVLEASRTALVVTAAEHAPVLDEALAGPPALGPRPRVLALERTLSREPAQGPDEAPDGAVRPAVPEDGLAYVIFTSGSTGVPKGAMVAHLGMINHLWAKRADLGLEAADCVAQTASQCFDISVWQLLLPLVVGGRAEIVTDEVSHDPARLLAAVARRRVTVLETVPSILGVLLEEEAAGRARGRDVAATPLRWMIPTGEALPPETARLWLRHHPEVPLLNAYGPTECSDDVSHAPIAEAPGTATRRMTIGRAVANTGLLVLDARLRPVLQGVTGELCVRGLGVGRGYLRDPKRTAEVFVPDPRSPAPGGRLYRTGDLAAWRSDGNLDFLGRRDHQVKIRGFRIELGEIESVLHDCAGVRDAVVVTGQVGGRGTELIAYAAPLAGTELSVEALEAELRSALPDYMMPARWVLMDALPLLSSGKVDRRALPAPEAADDLRASRAPRSLTEELVAGIWSALLGIDRVGVDEDFFRIGGHSLVATRVIARVRQAFGVEVPLQDLFREPTIAALAARIDRARSVGDPARPPLGRRRRDGEIPLSFAQQRLWLIDQLQPGLTAYNIAEALEVRGELDSKVLARALGEVVRRHESLRTTFSLGSDGPVQVIAPAPPAGAAMELPVVDLEGLAGPAAMETARELGHRHAAWPFDLAAGPLFRCLLARLSPDRHVLYLAMHHVVGDGASDEVLVRELVPLYRAFAAGRPSPLPELPVQYPDFTLWQREWLDEEVLAEHVGYWRRKLTGLPASLEMPFDRPRPAIQTFAGASHRFVLGEELAAAVIATSRNRSVTPYMLVLATFASLLARYSGQRDLALGTPIAGRDQVELEGLVGFFVNTLVLRLGAAPDDRFSELLARARDTVIEAQAHQALPFERLVEELRPVRRLEHSPLFQALVNHAVADRRPPVPDLDLRPLDVETRTSQFDLTLTIVETGGVLRGALTYVTDLFDASTAQRLVAGFRTALAAVTAEPETTLAALPLISEAERHQVTREWSDAALDRPSARSTLDGIAERIAALPDAVAVSDARGALSYCGLDALAARIAAGLARFGPRAEDRIGVLVDRSALLPAALLGIWRAGCAYVPLDPAYPAERLAFMLRDSGAVALLADRDPAAVVPGWEGPVVRLDRPLAVPAAAPVPALDPASLAYVLYTSGSTGLPKGVGVPHGALYNFLAGMKERLGFGSGDRMLAVTSPSFDIAGLELYLPLLEGGSVAVADRESVLDGEWLREDWERTGATWLQGTPGIWSGLLAAGWPGARPGRALCGGEAMPAALAVSLAARAEAAWNLYGPTETTVWSTAWQLDRSAHVSVPIGTPIANTTVRVLDDALRAVPLGVFGELVLGGAGVARGYLGRPARTAEVFVPDPEAEAPGSRAYRTGDRARLRPGGVLEYAGRRDHQVKLRGNRIELGEIEAALGAHPAVAQGVVALRSDGPDDPRLVAYVTAPGGAPSADELRRFVADRLPAAMVPSLFVHVDELPRTPNGKVDRGRLPAPEAPSASERLFAPPRNDAERRIAAVWREVLGTGEVGIHDNFFDLGGQSLLLARVHARLRQEEGGENLALVDLFRYPTIAELATLLADGAGGPSEAAAPTIEERVSQLRTGAERRRRSRDLRRVAVGEGDE